MCRLMFWHERILRSGEELVCPGWGNICERVWSLVPQPLEVTRSFVLELRFFFCNTIFLLFFLMCQLMFWHERILRSGEELVCPG